MASTSVRLEKCPLTMRHMANAAMTAAEKSKSAAAELCSRSFGGTAPQRPKQCTPSTLASTQKLITRVVDGGVDDLVSKAELAKHDRVMLKPLAKARGRRERDN